MYFEGEDFSTIYKDICKRLLKEGKPTSPRDMSTQEIQGVIFKLFNPRTRILDEKLRNVSIPFAIGEWLWCMEGRDDLEMIKYYAPSYGKYSDDNKTLNGAYGPRIKRCLDKAIELLKKDSNSRRTVIPIYNEKDVGLNSNDIPCTLNWQFFIRNNKLDMCVNMRSNDIFLGLPYDVFNFTMWQEYIACKLNIEIGTYTHMVGSMHFYEKDKDKIKRATDATVVTIHSMPKMPIKKIDKKIEKLYTIEENIRKGKTYDDIKNNDDYFSFFVEALENYNKKITEGA